MDAKSISEIKKTIRRRVKKYKCLMTKREFVCIKEWKCRDRTLNMFERTYFTKTDVPTCVVNEHILRLNVFDYE